MVSQRCPHANPQNCEYGTLDGKKGLCMIKVKSEIKVKLFRLAGWPQTNHRIPEKRTAFPGCS